MRNTNRPSCPPSAIFTTIRLDSQVETNDLALLISIAVDKMPDQRRRIFRMSRYEGLSNREIAERLRISVKTVENHMTAALGQLRRLLASITLFF